MADQKQTLTTTKKIFANNPEEVAKEIERHVQYWRCQGWHFSSHAFVNMVENDKAVKYILCTFCK